MSSSLSPAIENFFIEHFEQRALKMATFKLSFFLLYVEDTFLVWPYGRERLK